MRDTMRVMSRTYIENILELSLPERIAAVQEIWESVIEDARTLPLTAAQRDELEKRWLELQRNPDEGEPWDEVKVALRSE
ncbi:MAG TPA: addiction module protein [Thermoanaerobaculia bacterium]|nr:addiction module protein [Thermoanaerobaculia bacterium]